MATILLSELEGKSLPIRKGAKIPLYNQPVWGSIFNPKPIIKNGKPLYFVYKIGVIVNIGKLIQYNGVNYYTTSAGYLIPANPKYFDLSSSMKSGAVKTSAERKEAEYKESQENFNSSWYGKLLKYSMWIGGVYVVGKLLIDYDKGRKK